MFFSRGPGKEGHEGRAAQPFLVSNTKRTARRGVWSTASGVASVPSSSFFAGLVQDPPSPFLHNPIPPPVLSTSRIRSSSSLSRTGLPPLSLLSVTPSLSRFPCTKQVRSKLLATISTSARLRLDIDIHRRMSPLEYSLLEAARVEHPPLCPRAHSTLRSLARSLALAPLPRPFSSTFHFVAVRPRGTLLNTVNNRRKEPLPVCKPCTVRPWLHFTYRRGDRCELHSTTYHADPRRESSETVLTEIFHGWDNCIYRGGKRIYWK